jgi:Cu(I)/Ag(I) efflux system membrane fusion protein
MKERCSTGGPTLSSTGHEGHSGAQAAQAVPNTQQKAILAKSEQTVFDNYLKVHGSLAQDSLEGVAGAATAMVKAILAEPKPMLSPKVVAQADALAKAQDLGAARAAFKPLSESLIQHLKDQNVPPGTYHEVYCPMAKAAWLQTEPTIANPYMGKEMLRCGQFKS